ncbi:hypothetical protein FJZ19_04050 [Candidatus Pacearchaeota archaeon]|nr:hypothetical protein [Candidatus Pacearchaeota archaeon]
MKKQIENLSKKRGVQKACSLMDRAPVSLTGGCGSEAFSGNPATPALTFRKNNKKENPSVSSMDRASLTVDIIANNMNYLNFSNLRER